METYITHRIPRPMGITSMAVQCSKTGVESSCIDLYKAFINQWALNNGTICGESYDVNSLISHFNIPHNVLQEYMKEKVLTSRIWDKEQSESLMQGLMSEQILWAMEDRMEVVNQANILKASQGGKYTPFISAELNKALKLRLDSTAALQKLIQSVSGGGTINIFTQINQQNNEVKEAEYITIEEARDILINNQEPLNKTEEAKFLEAKYNLNALPEVVAINQEGIDTSKEALNLNATESKAITDDYNGAIKAFEEDHHSMRREIENNIEPDEDPELAIYEEIPEEPQFRAMDFLNK